MADDDLLRQLLRRRLKAQADLFAALTSHPMLIGRGREDALAELFRQFMPKRFEVLEGTVAIVDSNHRPVRSTNQLDLIVADTMDFPTLLRSGNVAVVLAQSVRAVMEVKSDLQRGASFVAALIQIARARQLLKATDPVFTGLFSFSAPANPETLRDWLADVVALRELLANGEAEQRIHRLRSALGPEVLDDAELLEILRNTNLPDVIASDRGAVASKAVGADGEALYMFLRGADEMPSVMIAIDRFVEQLSATATPKLNTALAVLRAHLSIDVRSDPTLTNLPLPEPA